MITVGIYYGSVTVNASTVSTVHDYHPLVYRVPLFVRVFIAYSLK